jgi:hypothetical protein
MIDHIFVTLVMRAGLCAAPFDPLYKRIIGTLRAMALIPGQEDYSMDYVKTFTEGRALPYRAY